MSNARVPEPGAGLAEQRTALAWTRSGLALLGAVVILARRVWSDGRSAAALLAVALLGAATLAWAIGIMGLHVRHRSSERRRRRPRRPGELLAVSLATVAVGLCGLVVTLLT